MYLTKTNKYFSLLLSSVLFFSTHVLAHVELNNPQGGETFFSGDTVLIKWTELATHDTQNWELYYSPDAGETWEVISNNISYPLREFKWAVPDEATTKGRIKVYMNNNVAIDYEDESPNFSITNITGIKLNPSIDKLFGSFKIIPNPVYSNASFNFVLDQPEQVSIWIYNLEGKKVDEIPERQFFPGLHKIPWKSVGLKPGNYFTVVNAGNVKKTFRFQIIR